MGDAPDITERVLKRLRSISSSIINIDVIVIINTTIIIIIISSSNSSGASPEEAEVHGAILCSSIMLYRFLFI